jgi:hypothetical protein
VQTAEILIQQLAAENQRCRRAFRGQGYKRSLVTEADGQGLVEDVEQQVAELTERADSARMEPGHYAQIYAGLIETADKDLQEAESAKGAPLGKGNLLADLAEFCRELFSSIESDDWEVTVGDLQGELQRPFRHQQIRDSMMKNCSSFRRS